VEGRHGLDNFITTEKAGNAEDVERETGVLQGYRDQRERSHERLVMVSGVKVKTKPKSIYKVRAFLLRDRSLMFVA
jgi:hypothetical protein